MHEINESINQSKNDYLTWDGASDTVTEIFLIKCLFISNMMRLKLYVFAFLQIVVMWDESLKLHVREIEGDVVTREFASWWLISLYKISFKTFPYKTFATLGISLFPYHYITNGLDHSYLYIDRSFVVEKISLNK